MTEQILAIWKYFFQFDVKYITIGGFAVNFHGYNRSTGDIDILLTHAEKNVTDSLLERLTFHLQDVTVAHNVPFIIFE